MEKVKNILSLNAYDYYLPENLIAQTPANPPDSCKLLIVEKLHPLKLKDEIFRNLPGYLTGNEVFFFNNTKVIKARIYLDTNKHNIQLLNAKQEKLSFSSGEIFFLKALDNYTFEALVRPGKKFKIGNKIILNKNTEIKVINQTPDGRILQTNIPVQTLFEKYGNLPLPPYIKFDEEKQKYYQSIFASKPGSVAAPTASLHFTPSLIEKIKAKGCPIHYVSLHIGLGTFKKVDVQDISQYDIHTETAQVDVNIFTQIADYKLQGKIIIAVGTTVTRTLETLPYLWKKLKLNGVLNKLKFNSQVIDFWENLAKDLQDVQKVIKNYEFVECNNNKCIEFETKLYIYPGGFKYKIINQLITNFHLPKSSLLMLVAAFMGYENMKKTYQYAINNQYRFFSFGDAMWIKEKI